MSQKKTKLLRKFARLTGADQLGSVSVVETTDKRTGEKKTVRQYHSHSKELKREYLGVDRLGKAQLSELHRQVIKKIESKKEKKQC